MKRILALCLALSCLLPGVAGAEKTVLRLLGLEESTAYRRANPNISFQQVTHNIWGDPMEWIAEKGADVVYLNGWKVDMQAVLSQPELLYDLSDSEEITEQVNRMVPWVQEFVTTENGSILAIPISAAPRCFSIRWEGWMAAGLTEEDIPQSYEELLTFLESWCDQLEEKPNPPARVADLLYWNTGTASCNYGYWLMELLMTCHAMQRQYAGEAVRFDTPEFIEYAERTRTIAQRLYRLEPRGQKAEKLPEMFNNGLNYGRAGNKGRSYELSCAMPMRLTGDQPALILVRADVIVIPARASHPEEALRFLADRAQSIPWYNAIALYSDFAPGEYTNDNGGSKAWVDAGWLAEYHSYEGTFYCCPDVFGANRDGSNGKEKYLLKFLKKEISASLFAQRLDGLLQ